MLCYFKTLLMVAATKVSGRNETTFCSAKMKNAKQHNKFIKTPDRQRCQLHSS
jgi:hypothetical protein